MKLKLQFKMLKYLLIWKDFQFQNAQNLFVKNFWLRKSQWMNIFQLLNKS